MTISSLTSRRMNASSTLTFNNCSTRPSPLDIPEILERIFSSLDRKSIFHSAQYVCRQWYLISRRFPTRPLVFDGDKPLSKSFKQVIEDQLSYAGSFYWVSKSLKDDRPNWDHFQGMLKSMHDNTNAHRATKPEELRVQAPLREFYFRGMFYLPCFLSALLYMDTLTSLHIDCLITVELPLDIILSTCSELVTLYLDGQSYLIRLAKHSTPLWSMNMDTQGPLERSSGDRNLKLESLTLKQCLVPHNILIDVLAVSPWLQELSLIAISTLYPTVVSLASGDQRQEQLVRFLRRACPRLRRLHYSASCDSISRRCFQKLIQNNSHVTEWSFMKANVTPELCRQLAHVQNTITYLEIACLPRSGMDIYVIKNAWHSRASEIGLVHSGLHTFLCSAPLLLHLKTDLVWCSAEWLDLFPESNLHSFKHTADAAGRNSYRSGVSNTTTDRSPRVWACRDLQTLVLSFTLSDGNHGRQLTAPASRVVFGYLSRVCPKLKQLYIGLGDLALDMASGLCLLSRMERLEVVVVRMSGGARPVWLERLDLSWMAKYPPSPWRKLFRRWEYKKWDQTLKDEEELIRRREAYLRPSSSSVINTQSFDMTFVYPLVHLGTLTDVKKCLDEMAAKGQYQCWPRLRLFCAEAVLAWEWRNLFTNAVYKVRPGAAVFHSESLK